jgi:hypothetical protein
MQIHNTQCLSHQPLRSLQRDKIKSLDFIVCKIEQHLLAPSDSNIARYISPRGIRANG